LKTLNLTCYVDQYNKSIDIPQLMNIFITFQLTIVVVTTIQLCCPRSLMHKSSYEKVTNGSDRGQMKLIL